MSREEIEDNIQYYNDKKFECQDSIERQQQELKKIDDHIKCLHHMLEIAKLKEDRLPADWVI